MSLNGSISRKIEDALAEKVLEQLDLDAMAVNLASHVQKRLTEDLKDNMDNDLNFNYMITEVLADDTTKAGKAFSKAVDKMTMMMIKSITPE